MHNSHTRFFWFINIHKTKCYMNAIFKNRFQKTGETFPQHRDREKENN